MKRSLKQKRNLERRIADYARMMNDPNSPARKAPIGAYHQPGSNQK